MGKDNNSQIKLQNSFKKHQSGCIAKQKKRRCFSTSVIQSRKKQRNSKIAKNGRKHLLKILKRQQISENNHKLTNILNIKSEKEIVCSAMKIPSIENIISMQDLKSYGGSDSILESNISFVESSEFIGFDSEPELMLIYLVLVQRALKNLGLTMPSRQNLKVIKGIWNILIKYWIDENQEVKQYQYQNIGEKIEWGLFQLLQYDLNANKNKITSLKQLN